MEDFIRYDKKYVPKVFGFTNEGSTCYFNAIMQSLLSCSAFNQVMLQNKDNANYKANLLAVEYTKILHDTDLETPCNSPSGKSQLDEKSSQPDYQNYKIKSNLNVWKRILQYSSQRKDNVIFSVGQQCSGEGLCLLLGLLDNLPAIERLFTYRIEAHLFCAKCKKWANPIKDESLIYNVPPTLINDQLEVFAEIDKFYKVKRPLIEYIGENTGYIDEAHICDLCKERGIKYQHVRLDMIPEILVVLSKKYNNMREKLNIMTEFPQEMLFTGKGGIPLRYEAVAQIEHSGSFNGGHYWAICQRHGKWYCINDSKCSPSEFNPTTDTYMVFYHIM